MLSSAKIVDNQPRPSVRAGDEPLDSGGLAGVSVYFALGGAPGGPLQRSWPSKSVTVSVRSGGGGSNLRVWVPAHLSAFSVVPIVSLPRTWSWSWSLTSSDTT